MSKLDWSKARKFRLGTEAFDADEKVTETHFQIVARCAALRAAAVAKRVKMTKGKITEEMIEAGKTSEGGWTRAQLQKWGVPWPPPRGWKKALIAGNPVLNVKRIRSKRRRFANASEAARFSEIQNQLKPRQ